MFKKLIWPLLLIMFSAGFLFAGEKKALPPTLPDTQEKCDQNEKEATPSDSFIASPKPPSKEIIGSPDSLTSPPLEIQGGTKPKV
jgi:hypothetical protein